MANHEKDEPTTPAPILVASGIGGDNAAEIYLTMMEWLLRDEMSLLADPEGEISAWLRDTLAKPVKFERHNIPEHNKAAVQRELMREIVAVIVHPQKKEEIRIGNLVAGIDSDQLSRTLEALRRGDSSAAEKIRAELVEGFSQKFKKQIMRESISALGSLVARG